MYFCIITDKLANSNPATVDPLEWKIFYRILFDIILVHNL